MSVIIPALNDERFLPGLLADLAARQFRDFEVIVADAWSRDRTREIARAAGARVVEGAPLASAAMPAPGWPVEVPVPVPPRRHADRFPVRRRRDSIWSALLGSLVIGSVSNGLDLMAQSPEIKYMVEGAIRQAAVTLDALARSSRTAAVR